MGSALCHSGSNTTVSQNDCTEKVEFEPARVTIKHENDNLDSSNDKNIEEKCNTPKHSQQKSENLPSPGSNPEKQTKKERQCTNVTKQRSHSMKKNNSLISIYDLHNIDKSGDVELEEPMLLKALKKIQENSVWNDRQPVRRNSLIKKGREQGKKTVNEYIMVRKLGKGTFGKVHLCMNKETGELRAIKTMNKSLLKKARRAVMSGKADTEQLLKMELAILEKVDHPNIVKLYEVIDDPHNDKFYMIFEYVEKGAVMQMLTNDTADRPPLSEDQARLFMIQLIYGLEYLHNMHVVHMDIKPENLLIDGNGTLKLTDFGVSKMFEGDDDTVYTNGGTPAFLAPEACRGGKYKGKPADIWAVGVTLYCLLYAKVPFGGDSIAAIFKSIQNDNPVFPKNINPNLKDLFSQILKKDPKKRITMEKLKVHPWITNNGEFVLNNPKLRNSLTSSCISAHDINNAINSETTLKILDKMTFVLN